MYCIGVDIGTNSTRAMLTDPKGRQLAIASRSYPLNCSRPGWAEQNAEHWYAAVAETVRDVLPENPGDVAGISFSTQGGSTLPVDANGLPLRPAISWMDNRSLAQAQRLNVLRGKQAWYTATGMTPSPHSSVSHIVYLAEHEPDCFARARWFLTTSDYINLKLTGKAAIDRTNALMTGMLHQKSGAWDPFALDAAGISVERLPEILPSGALVGGLTAQAASDLGLPEGTPVYNGVHDQYACALGCGAVHAGDSMLSCGTAWVLLGVSNKTIPDAHCALTPGFHAVENMRGAFYAISAGSQTLNWVLRQTGLSVAELDEANRISATRISQNQDLFFYPYLAGPVNLDQSQRAQGILAGLSLSTDRYDLVLAAMEGIVFETVRAISLFAKAGLSIAQLRMLGGAANSDLWAEILSAASGLAVARPQMNESALMGAAMLALTGSKAFPDLAHASGALLGDIRVTEPAAARKAFYEEKYARYLRGHDSAMELCRKVIGAR